MTQMFLDLRKTETVLHATLPEGANSSDFASVEVPVSPPTCCRNCVFDWAICYEVPGNLHTMVANMKMSCGR